MRVVYRELSPTNRIFALFGFVLVLILNVRILCVCVYVCVMMFLFVGFVGLFFLFLCFVALSGIVRLLFWFVNGFCVWFFVVVVDSLIQVPCLRMVLC